MKILYERLWQITPEMMRTRTYREPPILERTPGLHVQAINKVLGVAAGKLTSDEDDDFPFERFTDKVYPLMPACGVAWEEFRASFYGHDQLAWQYGEESRDGIVGTPDGLMIHEDAQWECKETTKKLQGVRDLWMYLKQGISYCAMSGLKRVHYDIKFVLGDYTRPYQPKSVEALVEFEDREIEQWWQNILKNKHRVEPEKAPQILYEDPGIEW